MHKIIIAEGISYGENYALIFPSLEKERGILFFSCSLDFGKDIVNHRSFESF